MKSEIPQDRGLAEPPPAVIAFDNQQVTAPDRPRDCTCLFCGLFRSHHYWWQAVLATALVPGALWLAHDLDATLRQQKTTGGGAMVAVSLLLATGVAVLALFTWYQPVRRLLHMRNPRSTAWPPPL